MKKRLIFGILAIWMTVCFSGCCLSHEWRDATCTEPQACVKCGKTKGKELGHVWTESDCTHPKSCSVCGETEGEPAGHRWKDATCTEPRSCSVCGATEGEALGHSWKEADCLEAKTCRRCHAIEGEALGHELNEFHACIRCKEYFGTGTYLNFSDVKVNDSLYLGSYGRYEPSIVLYQRESKPIEWIVLDKQEDKLLVLSKYFLYQTSSGSI